MVEGSGRDRFEKGLIRENLLSFPGSEFHCTDALTLLVSRTCVVVLLVRRTCEVISLVRRTCVMTLLVGYSLPENERKISFPR